MENPPRSHGANGGAIAAKRPNPSDDGAGEDRLSALPNDILVLILLRLDTAAAIKTSALSRRWHSVWTLLPELRFHNAPDGPHIRELLEAPHTPRLRCISVTTEGVGPDSAAAWLPVAARRLIGGLVYRNKDLGNDDEEEEAVGRGDVRLPCFEKATTIEVDLGFLGLALPSLGVFARLTERSLRHVLFGGLCELGSLVSTPRCPGLKKLQVCESQGLQNLSVDSESLLQMKLRNLGGLQKLTIVAPTLQKDIHVQYLMGDITILPQISLLHVVVINQGPAFGASLFHLLRICTILKRLALKLHTSSILEPASACPPGCICGQPTGWKTEELLLNHLEDIRIRNVKGVEHEVALLKQLFNWAKVLKCMVIIFDYQVSESKAREFRQALSGFSRPETYVEFCMCEDEGKRSLVLLTPEDEGTELWL